MTLFNPSFTLLSMSYMDVITGAVIMYLKRTGVTQTALGRSIGLSKVMISQRLHGVTRWTIDDLEALDALGVGASAALVGACDE